MNQLPARFANRQQHRSIATAVVKGLGSASPPYVSLKGGVFTLVDSNGAQEPVDSKWLDCVIFDVNADVPIQRVFWGKDRPFDPNADFYVPPVCFSDNGVGASQNASEPQSTHCQSCPWNVWGSATSKVTGKGVKACQAIKKVAVVVPGWEFPFLLRVPVMSHENLRVYGDKFKGQEFDVSDVVTRIAFVHGQVGQIDFAATGFTDDATEALIQKLLDSRVTDSLIGRGDMAVQSLLPPPSPAQIGPQQAASPSPPQPVLPQSKPAKRERKKAETPAVAAGPFSRAPDDSIPPFLRRDNGTGPGQTAIQQNVPAPNDDLQAALDNVFSLKT